MLDEQFLRFDERLARFTTTEQIEDDNEDTPLLSRLPPPELLSRLFNAHLFRVPFFENLAATHLDTRFSQPLPPYPEDTRRNAYHPPEVTVASLKLWIVKDSIGVSRQEIERTREVVDITDEKAHFNGKSRIEWDEERIEDAPIFKAVVYY